MKAQRNLISYATSDITSFKILESKMFKSSVKTFPSRVVRDNHSQEQKPRSKPGRKPIGRPGLRHSWIESRVAFLQGAATIWGKLAASITDRYN